MESVVTYEVSTGRVIRICSNPAWLELEQTEAALCATPSVAVIVDTAEPLNSSLLWFMAQNGTLLKRGTFPELQVVGGVISGVPDNTLVTWPDQVITTESQEFEFSSNVSDTFTFILDAVPYLPYTLEVQYHD